MYKFYVKDLSNKKVLILVLNEARDGAQWAAGGRNSTEWVMPGRRLLFRIHVLSLLLGTHSRLLCQKPESAARLTHAVPLQQTAEILWSETMQGFVPEDQDLVVHTGRHRHAAPCTQVSHAQTWAWASGFWRHCSGSAAACRWETGWLRRAQSSCNNSQWQRQCYYN